MTWRLRDNWVRGLVSPMTPIQRFPGLSCVAGRAVLPKRGPRLDRRRPGLPTWRGAVAPLGLAVCLFPLALQGQVTVEVDFPRGQYLASEPIQAAVRIVNFSGQTLHLGDRPGWLDLTIEDHDGVIVPQHSEPPVLEAFELPSASRATRRVDLVPHFDLSKAGRYLVTATVRIPELSPELTSKPKPLIITSGARIWEQAFGIRNPEASGPPEVRKYALIQANHDKGVSLYVRISDATDTKVHKVLQIGPMLAFSQPETQVDSFGELHVLWQTAARQFTYVRCMPDGEITGRQTHQYTDSRPRLRTREEGTIVVSGGLRLFSPTDIPKPESVPAQFGPADAKTTPPPEPPSEK